MVVSMLAAVTATSSVIEEGVIWVKEAAVLMAVLWRIISVDCGWMTEMMLVGWTTLSHDHYQPSVRLTAHLLSTQRIEHLD